MYHATSNRNVAMLSIWRCHSMDWFKQKFIPEIPIFDGVFTMVSGDLMFPATSDPHVSNLQKRNFQHGAAKVEKLHVEH